MLSTNATYEAIILEFLLDTELMDWLHRVFRRGNSFQNQSYAYDCPGDQLQNIVTGEATISAVFRAASNDAFEKFKVRYH